MGEVHPRKYVDLNAMEGFTHSEIIARRIARLPVAALNGVGGEAVAEFQALFERRAIGGYLFLT